MFECVDHLATATKEFDAGDFARARVTLKQVLASQKPLLPIDRARTLRLLSEAERELAEYAQAQEDARAGLDVIAQFQSGAGVRERILLLTALGQAFINAGSPALAEAPLKEALQLSAPDAEIDGALALRTLGEVRWAAAQYAEAETLYRRAWETLHRLLPADHRERGHVTNSWGLALVRLGHQAQAEAVLRDALEERLLALPADHPDVGESFHNLTHVAIQGARLEEAEGYALQALEIWQAKLGDRHPRIALVLGNLGGIALKRGRLSEAQQFYRRGLEIREAVLGPDNPLVAISINNLASIAQKLNQLEDAEQLLRRSLAIEEAARAPNHPNVARILNNLQQVLTQLGRDDEGETLLRRAISIWESNLDAHAADLATSWTNLSLLLKRRGEMDEAETLLLRALAVKQQRRGENHPDLATPLNNLAEFYVRAGRLDMAETLFLRAVRLRENAGHAVSPETAANLAEIARVADRRQEEVWWLRKTIQIVQLQAGSDTAKLVPYLRRQGRALLHMKDFTDAQAVLRRALALGEGHDLPVLDTAATSVLLGLALAGSKQWEEAVYCFERAMLLAERAGDTEAEPPAQEGQVGSNGVAREAIMRTCMAFLQRAGRRFHAGEGGYEENAR